MKNKILVKKEEFLPLETKSLIDIQTSNVFTIQNSKSSFLKRLYFLISNPFLYIFKGKIRL
jgi:hypothetical protein